MLTRDKRPVADSPLRYPWADMKLRLDDVQADYVMLDYKDATSGSGPISPTLGAMAIRITARKTARPQRDTCSYVLHVVAGSGTTELKGEHTATIRWSKGDTFAIPAWSHIVHLPDAGENAYLFGLTDRPFLEGLSMYIQDNKK